MRAYNALWFEVPAPTFERIVGDSEKTIRIPLVKSASIPADSAWLFLTCSAFLYSKDSQNLSFSRQPQLMRINLVAYPL
jgi:hypothetical protein